MEPVSLLIGFLIGAVFTAIALTLFAKWAQKRMIKKVMNDFTKMSGSPVLDNLVHEMFKGVE